MKRDEFLKRTKDAESELQVFAQGFAVLHRHLAVEYPDIRSRAIQAEYWERIVTEGKLYREVDWHLSEEIRHTHQLKTKQCWYNSQLIAALHAYEYLDYCEGHATTGLIPMEHAWLVVRDSGKVVDPTWVVLPREQVEYLGVVIPRDYVREFVMQHLEEDGTHNVEPLLPHYWFPEV